MSLSLGPLTLHAYGFLLALSVFTATFLTARSAKSKGLDPEVIWDALFLVLIFGLIGARAYHVVHLWNFYSPDPRLIYQIWFGGMGIWGAMMGGLAGALLFAKIRRISGGDFLAYLNLAAPYIALGQAIGRVGNVVNGELLPFAYYEAAWDFATFLLLAYGLKHMAYSRLRVVDSKRRQAISHKLFAISFPLYLILYGSGRFFLEFTRTDSWSASWRIGSFGGGLAIAQIFSIIAVVSGLIFLLPKNKWPRLH